MKKNTDIRKQKIIGNLRFEVKKLLDFYWIKARKYKIEIPLDVFADVYTLIRDCAAEDIRKAELCHMFGFDVYAIKVKPTFVQTIEANADWMKIADERFNYAEITGAQA